MNPSLRLYFAHGANCADRVRWQLAYKSISCDLVDVDAAPSDQFMDHSPFGRVPLLVVDGRPLSESMAIAELIEELFPERPLLGRDAWGRARVREVCEAVNSSIHPAQNGGTARFYLPESTKEEVTPVRVRWLATNLDKLQPLLWRESSFAVGEEFSLADIFVASIYRKLRQMSCGAPAGLAAYEQHLTHLLSVPDIRAACPDLNRD